MDKYSNTLTHYGVLGMRWGVRQGHTNVMDKAQKKMNKLDTKSEKKQYKYTKSLYKHYDSDGTKQKKKKAFIAAYKAAKWYKDVTKVMGAEKAETMVNSKQVNMGKKYTTWFLVNKG